MSTRAPRRTRSIAIAIVGALIAGACSGGGSPEDGTLSPEAAEEAGVEFGASIDEYLEAARKEAEAKKAAAEAAGEQINDFPDGYPEIGWEDLRPDDTESTVNLNQQFADRIDAAEPGSAEAEAVYAELQAEYDRLGTLVSPELDGQSVTIPGFVAPLAYEGDLITEFLLVPYFGACIHVPAPPPNQTVLIKVPASEGLSFDDSWGAVWVSGTLKLEKAETDLATTSYQMTGIATGVYQQQY